MSLFLFVMRLHRNRVTDKTKEIVKLEKLHSLKENITAAKRTGLVMSNVLHVDTMHSGLL